MPFQLNFDTLRTAAQQIGVLCTVGGVVATVTEPFHWPTVLVLTGVGIALIFLSSIHRK